MFYLTHLAREHENILPLYDGVFCEKDHEKALKAACFKRICSLAFYKHKTYVVSTGTKIDRPSEMANWVFKTTSELVEILLLYPFLLPSYYEFNVIPSFSARPYSIAQKKVVFLLNPAFLPPCAIRLGLSYFRRAVSISLSGPLIISRPHQSPMLNG